MFLSGLLSELLPMGDTFTSNEHVRARCLQDKESSVNVMATRFLEFLVWNTYTVGYSKTKKTHMSYGPCMTASLRQMRVWVVSDYLLQEDILTHNL